MPANFIQTGDRINKSSFIAANSDYSCIFWFRNKSTPAGADYKSPFVLKNADYSGYVAIYSDSAADTYRVWADNGSGASNTAAITPVLNHWYGFAYTRGGNVHTFWSDGVNIGSITVDISGLTFTDEIIGYDGFSIGNFEVFGFREFPSNLTQAQLIAELNSVSPILTAFCDTPLNLNYNDTTGGTGWTNSGTDLVTGPTQVPLTNTTGANAFAFTLPGDFVQIVNTGGGTNSDVWYKFTSSSAIEMVGAWGFSKNIGSGYRPLAKLFDSPTVQDPTLLTGQNKPIQFQVQHNTDYWLKFEKNGNTTPAQIRVQIQAAPITPFLVGGILVPDDTPGFPIVMVSGNSDYTVLNAKANVAASEAGATLQVNNLYTIADDLSGANVFNIYDSGFNLIKTIAALTTGTFRAGANQTANKMYLGNGGDATHHARWCTIDQAAVQGTIVELPANGLTALCGDNTNAILYYSGAGGSGNNNIKRWDIVGGVGLTDLVASVGAGYQVGDILIMPDTTLLVSYFKVSATRDFFVKHYNTAGATLNTYNFGSDHESAIPRLAYALNATSFFVWTHPTSTAGLSIFRNIRISDGATLSTSTQIEFIAGVYGQAETPTPLGRFGNSNSCPFFLFSSVTFNGIYVIVKGKTNDTLKLGSSTTVVKIPDPTWRTGPLPTP